MSAAERDDGRRRDTSEPEFRRVAVLDVGSNTVSLLVSEWRDGSISPVRRWREDLFLGADVESVGQIGSEKLKRLAKIAEDFGERARLEGAAVAQAVLTAPGRHAGNVCELVDVLATATGWPTRVLSPDEECHLAFEGAISGVAGAAGVAAVCDVGGGSTELVVGPAGGVPTWKRSLPVGCARLAERFSLASAPDAQATALARSQIAAELLDAWPPRVDRLFAAGGTARALTKIVDPPLGAIELEQAIETLCCRSVAQAPRTPGPDAACGRRDSGRDPGAVRPLVRTGRGRTPGRRRRRSPAVVRVGLARCDDQRRRSGRVIS